MKTRPFHHTISLDDARQLIDQNIAPITRVERLLLQHAHGRVLAVDVVAAMDVPPFARAGMDGFAVRARDTTGASRRAPVALMVVEEVFTGDVPRRPIESGQCAAIATGAPMPDGADAVVMVEETDGGTAGGVQLFAAVQPGQNVGRQGADIRTGQTVLAGGAILHASRLGALAALGHAEVDVYEKPRVAVLSTGNEIVEADRPLGPGQIYDINTVTLSAVVQEHGGVPVPHRVAADTVEDLERVVEACLAQDVLVFSGGSSVGERDLIVDVVAAKGTLVFHGIAVKPGKPTAFGRIGGKPCFGMPGYPTSCLSNAHILLAPALRRIARLPTQLTKSVMRPLGARVASAPGRHQFYSVRLVGDVAMPAFKASGDITSMSEADGYIEIPASQDAVEQGEIVEVKLF